MCGIYAIVSSREVPEAPGEEFFHQVETLVGVGDTAAIVKCYGEPDGPDRVQRLLEDTQGAARRWLGRGALLELLGRPDLRDRLSGAAAKLESWLGHLEAALASGEVSDLQRVEALNRVTVGCRDVAWQIERDILEGVAGVLDLVEEPVRPALARAYELHMTLRSLDRLEVRGRDSAGIVAYARFPDAAALDAFLDGSGGGGQWRGEFESRRADTIVQGTVVRPPRAPHALLLSFKVASEIGKMGDNVRFLRRAIAGDRFFQALLREPELEIQMLAHTRWASNGIISEANCHPVDGTVMRRGECLDSQGGLVAVLNGDIDNYQELRARYVEGQGLELDPAITTDAKIIPIVIEHHLARRGNLAGAFRAAVSEFEGSMAICVMAADHPGELFLAQKGSGQGLFFGSGQESMVVASEMYGVVELTPVYLKAEGERHPGGEVFHLAAEDHGVRLELLDGEEFVEPPSSRWKTAEITTRDINRGDYPHFFLKEITESVESVRKTLRGKTEVSREGAVRFLLGSDVVPDELVDGLREGRVRNIHVIGQGTAAVAAEGVAYLLQSALARLPHPIKVVGEKATELSAQGLRFDMSDSLVVAISQSGTTTDTNRTVDLARERGAWVLAIVNRRNSDLVYKSHGVLYTSDGRDIEMSVASTKAFYAQNVAGQVLALALAGAVGSMTDTEIARAVDDLKQLPDVLQETLGLTERIARLASEYALGRRHWAVVGSGPGKIAANEIRIKLSELCYKSIALDYLEDKKHIDLSSEPLILVCACGMRPELLSDSVKEVAIFKAHNGVPLVITDEDTSHFAPYAKGTLQLPSYRGALCYLPATMAGHLLGYYSARAMDEVAAGLRQLRAEFVKLRGHGAEGDGAIGEIVEQLSASAAEPLVRLDQLLLKGGLDAALGAASAVRLGRVLELCLGRLQVDAFARMGRGVEPVSELLLTTLSETISDLSRPVDAIKHQAKTVTVGISRGEAVVREGVLWQALRELAISPSEVVESLRAFISAFEALVDRVEGSTVYSLSGLDALGRPTLDSRIRVERKTGCAAGMESRCDSPVPLSGNKWAVAKHREAYLGYGHADRRKILILPVGAEGREGRQVLLHLVLSDRRDRDERLKALAARGRFLDRVKASVTERDEEWDPSKIDALDNDALFLEPPERVAERLVEVRSRA